MRWFAVVTLTLQVVLLSACSGTDSQKTATPPAAAATEPDAVTADPGHYTVLFENDKARVLRIKYAPHAKSVMHTHAASCAVFLVDQKFNFTLPSGEVQTVDNHAGDVTCGDADVHLPENVGDKDAELILMELKNRRTFDNLQTGRSITVASQPNVHDAIAADPRHYSVQFENDVIRVLRIKYGPGEKSVMHAHPASCGVNLSGSTIKMTPKDGAAPVPSEAKAGEFDCTDAEAHLPENIGKTAAETILMEFKNRQTVK